MALAGGQMVGGGRFDGCRWLAINYGTRRDASLQTANIYYLPQFGAIGHLNNGHSVGYVLVVMAVFIGGAQLLISSLTEFQLLCSYFVVDKIITPWLIISP